MNVGEPDDGFIRWIIFDIGFNDYDQIVCRMPTTAKPWIPRVAYVS